MARDLLDFRPRLSQPFDVLGEPDTVRLVAGEDFRYTMRAPGLGTWLPALLSRLDGKTRLRDALDGLGGDARDAALRLVERLYGERVLVEGTAAGAHAPARFRLRVEGAGRLAERLAAAPGDGERDLALLCQDRLDYAAALRFNRRALEGRFPWIWATTGPLQRGYAGPLFLPDAGPCFACLLAHFRRLSPAPELYDALAGRTSTPPAADFRPEGIEILAQLARWKGALAADPAPPPALFALHVLEVATLEVTSHAVLLDPECAECGGRG